MNQAVTPDTGETKEPVSPDKATSPYTVAMGMLFARDSVVFNASVEAVMGAEGFPYNLPADTQPHKLSAVEWAALSQHAHQEYLADRMDEDTARSYSAYCTDRMHHALVAQVRGLMVSLTFAADPGATSVQVPLPAMSYMHELLTLVNRAQAQALKQEWGGQD